MISVFAPVDAERRGGANKLRGLEVDSVTGRILLLDTDIFTFHSVSALSTVRSGIAACPSDIRRLPDHYWTSIFEALGLKRPAERMASVVGQIMSAELKARLPENERRKHLRMLPYFNSGVVLTDEPERLRSLWEQNIRAIASLFDPSDSHRRWLSASDQAGLAVSIQQLLEVGVSFEVLPSGANTRWLHAATGAVPWEQSLLYHATGLFRPFPGWNKQELAGAVRDYATQRIENPVTGRGTDLAVFQPNPKAAHAFSERFVLEVEAILERYVFN